MVLHEERWTHTAEGTKYIAHGRDPYFPPWSDTAQLNYFNPDLYHAMREELLRIAPWCDGVWCDMAMLCIPDVFAHTWQNILAWTWYSAKQLWIVTVNYADVTSQCFLRVAALPLPADTLLFRDHLQGAAYECWKTGSTDRGLYVELAPFMSHVFEVIPKPA